MTEATLSATCYTSETIADAEGELRAFADRYANELPEITT